MFTEKNFYKHDNDRVLESYQDTILRIREICEETSNYGENSEKKEYFKFFNHVSNFILKLAELERAFNDNYFFSKPIEELKDENYKLFSELLPENYEVSYANPTYGVKIFGEKIGQAFSSLYCRYRSYISYAFEHKIFKMEVSNGLFIEAYNYVRDNEVSYEGLTELIRKYEVIETEKYTGYFFKERYNKDFQFFTDITENSDLKDLRYLFKYGEYISENEIKTAQFLLEYPVDKINTLTRAIAKAYVNGFVRDNKDITKRSDVRIICNVGQERLVRHLIQEFKVHDLKAFVSEVISTDVNKQYDYDHKFDDALYLDKELTDLRIKTFEDEGEKSNGFLKDYSGIMYIEKFGESPFSPENKKERLKLSDDQLKLYQNQRNKMRETIEKHMPDCETSFCIVAFPTPEIGENFEEIFEDTMMINMLDSDRYEVIQQAIIDALDRGEYVYVKGNKGNETDIKVKLNELKNPDKETNFVNCVADVNIPVGEVFTSPVLKDTNGVLHIDEVYLEGFKYYNLKLTFKDGYVSDYSCTNFEDEEANKEYIRENLLFPHKTLPLGEFAIGTNTLAYVIAEKYGIIDKLPVLIIEKMGPHFAIGDTCFSWAEDLPVYNLLDKKEIIARDNEKSILRKTNIEEAYTNVHTDITLPYDALEEISVITKDGEKIEIIRDGRFVLKGTEELNEPFSK
ncbi:aminopeptidase [Wukongibacter baidiensis]|uniref:aminopeptidase n=1 Tax=Wukongibacter baidiensis TaxID=1723361 RepID=UPI003D7F21C0